MLKNALSKNVASDFEIGSRIAKRNACPKKAISFAMARKRDLA
jgi:hypothetical protein